MSSTADSKSSLYRISEDDEGDGGPRRYSAPLPSRPKFKISKTSSSAPVLGKNTVAIREEKLLRRFWGDQIGSSFLGPEVPLKEGMIQRRSFWMVTDAEKSGRKNYRKYLYEVKKIERAIRLTYLSENFSSRESWIAAEFVYLVALALFRDVEKGSKTSAVLDANGVFDFQDIKTVVFGLGIRILRDTEGSAQRMLVAYRQDGGFRLRDVFMGVDMVRDAIGPVSAKLNASTLIGIQVVKMLLLLPSLLDSFRDFRGGRLAKAATRVNAIPKLELDKLFLSAHERRKKTVVLVEDEASDLIEAINLRSLGKNHGGLDRPISCLNGVAIAEGCKMSRSTSSLKSRESGDVHIERSISSSIIKFGDSSSSFGGNACTAVALAKQRQMRSGQIHVEDSNPNLNPNDQSEESENKRRVVSIKYLGLPMQHQQQFED